VHPLTCTFGSCAFVTKRSSIIGLYKFFMLCYVPSLSEVLVWPIFDFRFWGKWPLMWKVLKMSFRIPRRNTELRFVTKFGENRPVQSCRKVLWITTQKLGLRGTRPSRHCAQNSLNNVTPWHVNVYRIWSGSAALCRTYCGKIDFSAPKVITLGCQPKIIRRRACAGIYATYLSASVYITCLYKLCLHRVRKTQA